MPMATSNFVVIIGVIRIILLQLNLLYYVWYIHQIGKRRSHFLSRYSLFSSMSTLQWHDDDGFSSRLQLQLLLHYIVFYIQMNSIISIKYLYSRANACNLGYAYRISILCMNPAILSIIYTCNIVDCSLHLTYAMFTRIQ